MGWVPGRGAGGQVLSQGSGCRASDEDDFTFNQQEGGRIVWNPKSLPQAAAGPLPLGWEAGEPGRDAGPGVGAQAGPPNSSDPCAHSTNVPCMLRDASYPRVPPLLWKGHEGHAPHLTRRKLRGPGKAGGRALCGRPGAGRWDAAGTTDPSSLSLRSGGASRQEALGFWDSGWDYPRGGREQ